MAQRKLPRNWSIELAWKTLAHANWKIAVIVFVTIPLLLKLGFWQLDRADEKRAIQDQFNRQMAAPPLTLTQLSSQINAADPQLLAFRRVQLSGRYLPEYTALLDNRIEQGKPGYHVYTALLSESDDLVWINRGWIAGAIDRSLPVIDAPRDKVDIVATVYIQPGEQIVLDEDQWGTSWPVRVQQADISRLNERVKADRVFTGLPFELRLEQAMPGELYVDWQLISTNPAKHTGYAVQWFAMAAALLAFWLYQLWKTTRDPEGA